MHPMNKRPHSQFPPDPSFSPSHNLVVSSADGLEVGSAALERLEELDDTIFAALDGDAEALDRSRMLWYDVRQEIDSPLLDESQAQYARRARTVWDAACDTPEDSLARAFAALEVLGMVEQD